MIQLQNNCPILKLCKTLEVTCLFTIIFLCGGLCKAQSLTGMNGGYSIPTGMLKPDKSVWFGYGFLNKKYYQIEQKQKRHYHIAFAALNFLPFLEVGVRISYQDGINSVGEKKYLGDRMASARIRALKESRWRPSLVVGLQGFYAISGASSSFFNSTYLVATKNIAFGKTIGNLRVTLGYGSDIVNARTYQFIGFFGGVSITPKSLEFLELMVEYDGAKLNAGMQITLFDHLVLLGGIEGLDSFSGAINYCFTLP